MAKDYSTIFNHLEKVSTVCSILSFWFGTQQKTIAWPISIAITLMNLPYYFYKELYVTVFHHFIHILISLYGWYAWAHEPEGGKKLQRISRTSSQEWLFITLSVALYMVFFYPVLEYVGARLPLVDMVRNVLTLVGLWATSRKKLETYLIWLVVNVISVYVHQRTKSYWFMCKYIFYLGLSIYSFYTWYRAYRKEALAITNS
ncbi:MAG: nicotinamide riboside transporter PnuC [Bacteroidota bacterium]